MGVGAALALGLIQGFTKNIEKEQQSRQLDRDTLRNANNLMLTAAVQGNLHPQNAAVIGAAIKDARGELDAKERIDIFGTRTEPINFDITELAPLLKYDDPNAKKADDQFKTIYRVGGDEFGLMSNFVESPNSNSARVVLAEIGANMTNSDFTTMIANNREMYEKIHGVATSAIKVINGTFQKAKLQATEGATFSQPTFDDRGLPQFLEFGTKMYNLPNLTQIRNASTKEAFQEITGERIDSVVQTGLGDFGIKLDTAEKKQAIVKIANQMKKGPDEIVQFLTDTFFEDAAEFVSEDKIVLVDGMIKLGAEFERLGNITALDPDIGLRRLDIDKAAEFYNAIERNAGGPESSLAQQIYILAPYMSGSKKEGSGVIGFGNTTTGMTRQTYVLKQTEGQFKSFGEIEAARNAIELTNDTLTVFRQKRAKLAEPLAYSELKKAVKFVFGGEGFIASAVKDLGFTGIYEGNINKDRTLREGEKYVDEEYVKSLNANVEKVRQEKGETYAELEALRVTLAFQMARAADPSGRLSNQDIEQQMVKLGTAFDTQSMALAKIDEISREFKVTQDRLDVLVKYGKGTDIIDLKGQAIIDAAIAVNHLKMERERMNYLGMNVGVRTQSYADMDRTPSSQYQGAFIVLNAAGLPVRKDNKNVLVDQDGNVLSPDQLVPIAEAPSEVTLPDGKKLEVEPKAEEKPKQDDPPPPAEGALDATKEETTGGNNSTGWTLKGRQGKWKYDSDTQTFVPFQQAS